MCSVSPGNSRSQLGSRFYEIKRRLDWKKALQTLLPLIPFRLQAGESVRIRPSSAKPRKVWLSRSITPHLCRSSIKRKSSKEKKRMNVDKWRLEESSTDIDGVYTGTGAKKAPNLILMDVFSSHRAQLFLSIWALYCGKWQCERENVDCLLFELLAYRHFHWITSWHVPQNSVLVRVTRSVFLGVGDCITTFREPCSVEATEKPIFLRNEVEQLAYGWDGASTGCVSCSGDMVIFSLHGYRHGADFPQFPRAQICNETSKCCI